MSKRETPLTLRYWEETGGTLVEEARIVEAGTENRWRDVDALLLLDGPRERHPRRCWCPDLTGRQVVVVQTKAAPLGMSLLGQAFFSRALVLKRFRPAAVRAVVLCTRGDAVLTAVARDHGIEVVVYPSERTGFG